MIIGDTMKKKKGTALKTAIIFNVAVLGIIEMALMVTRSMDGTIKSKYLFYKKIEATIVLGKCSECTSNGCRECNYDITYVVNDEIYYKTITARREKDLLKKQDELIEIRYNQKNNKEVITEFEYENTRNFFIEGIIFFLVVIGLLVGGLKGIKKIKE